MTRFITRMEQFVKLTGVNPDITVSNNVALVGSSAILLEKKYGSLIDSYDTVIRFNRAPTIGFETYVGAKTTIRIANPHVFSNISAEEDKRFPNPKVTHPKNFIREQEKISVIHANNDASGWDKRDQHVHPTSKAFLMEPISFNYLPTVGLRGISLMVKNNIFPHLFGFGINEDSNATHYWEFRDPTSIHHNYSSERALLKKWASDGKIKIFT